MRFSDSIIPLLVQVQQFCAQPSGTATELSKRLDTLILEVRTQAVSHGHAAADIDAALFAVLAWCDEALSTSGWADAGAWSRHLLQKRYFGITNAGVEFFRKLDALDASRHGLREVFVLCLQLGFRGKYAYEQSPQSLSDLRRAQLAQLMAGRHTSVASGPLFPDGYASTPIAPVARRRTLRQRLTTWPAMALLGPAAALLAFYAVYFLVIDQMVTSLLPQMP